MSNALLQWELYERGIKERMKTESATLKRLAGDMQTTLTQYQEAERTQTKKFDELHEAFINQQTEQQSSFDEIQQHQTESWELHRIAAQSELDTIKNTYDQHMAIAAPVDYWETKRIKHRDMTRISGIAVIVGMISIGSYLSSQMQSINVALTAQPIATPSTQASSSVLAATSASATWQLGTFLMLAVLGFWFIRILVRIFLSNMHLKNDAAERVTMAKTYLALIRSNSLSKDENIDTVLVALFRPTGDGIVKDEGLPPSAIEFFTKLGK